jgi:hypothetical protein
MSKSLTSLISETAKGISKRLGIYFFNFHIGGHFENFNNKEHNFE